MKGERNFQVVTLIRSIIQEIVATVSVRYFIELFISTCIEVYLDISVISEPMAYFISVFLAVCWFGNTLQYVAL